MPATVNSIVMRKLMKPGAAVFGFLVSLPLLAAEGPRIAVGDYLLVYARVTDCGPERQAIEAELVDEEGVVTLFGDVALVAEDRAVNEVRDELVDRMEDRTGHRSESLELVHIPASDAKAVATRLVQFAGEVKRRCPRIVLPPGDLDPNWVKEFERLVQAPHNKSSNQDAPCVGAGYFKRLTHRCISRPAPLRTPRDQFHS